MAMMKWGSQDPQELPHCYAYGYFNVYEPTQWVVQPPCSVQYAYTMLYTP